MSLGSAHTCAILDDDTLKCWGQGVHIGAGLLGYGDTTQRNAPEATAVVNLGAGRTAKAVAAGSSHTCAILDDGTLKCWGYNNFGQLGYGDKASRNAPDATEVVNLGPGRTAKAVAAGEFFYVRDTRRRHHQVLGLWRRCRGRHDPDIAACG